MNWKKRIVDWVTEGKRKERRTKEDEGTLGQEVKEGKRKAKIYGAAAGICLVALLAGVITGKALLEKKVTVLQAARMEREKSGQAREEEERAT
ncbi:MAG: hypothetical protein K2P19_06250, partial [Kineothrix sp.]|nr:hypothetical protein [Kineothrix sp.]